MVENRRRTTKQRLAIRALFDDEPFFLTAQQVHDQLRNRGDQVGLATVYRNLQTMAEDGELDAIRAEDGEMTYRRCSSAHHHHLVCRNCGKAVEIGPEKILRIGLAISPRNMSSARPATNWNCSESVRSAPQCTPGQCRNQRRSRGMTKPSSHALTRTSRRLRTPSFFAR